MGFVPRGHVVFQGGISARLDPSKMRSDLFPLVKDLHGGGSVTKEDFFSNIVVRNTVVKSLELHVVVDVHPGHLILTDLKIR
jgi:hypothetical protein